LGGPRAAGSFPGASVLSRRQQSLLQSSSASVAGLRWIGPACHCWSLGSLCYLTDQAARARSSVLASHWVPRLTSLSNSGRTSDFRSRRRNRSAPLHRQGTSGRRRAQRCCCQGASPRPHTAPTLRGSLAGWWSPPPRHGSRLPVVPFRAGQRTPRVAAARARRASRSASRLASAWRLS
jgi:hypothetical protein